MVRMRCLIAVIVLSAMAGCSGAATERETGSATGMVSLDGEPVTAGSVNFRSNESGSAATAALDSSGTFQVDTMLTGTYQVFLAPPEPTPDDPQPAAGGAAIPEKYREAATSGFTADVKPGENRFEFSMVR